jgi:hypothetical protein
MKKLGPDFFSATKGEIVKFTVESVNMVSNAELDPTLNPVVVTDFKTTGQFTMGDADQTIVISYGFPANVPDGKYTRILSSGDLTDGPFDVTKPTGETRADIGYQFKFATADNAAAAGGKKNEAGK